MPCWDANLFVPRCADSTPWHSCVHVLCSRAPSLTIILSLLANSFSKSFTCGHTSRDFEKPPLNFYKDDFYVGTRTDTRTCDANLFNPLNHGVTWVAARIFSSSIL
jgi:hypothetical protein